MRFLLLFAVFMVLMYSFGSSFVERSITDGSIAALLITGINKVELEQTIVDHYRSNILKDSSALNNRDDYELQLTYTNINQDDTRDVVARLESDATCGGGGCITTIFLQNDMRQFEPISFEYAAHSIDILDSITLGMHDLRINDDPRSRMTWNGRQYVLESI
jgi:hypothetical protein